MADIEPVTVRLSDEDIERIAEAVWRLFFALEEYAAKTSEDNASEPDTND
jgi:hypothetical protein